MNLGLLFFEQPHQLVVLLDGLQRLDIDRQARRTRPVHHAADAPLEFAAHRNDEAVAANGDDVVLRRPFRRKLAQRGAQRSPRSLGAAGPARGECGPVREKRRRPASHRAGSCARSTPPAAAGCPTSPPTATTIPAAGPPRAPAASATATARRQYRSRGAPRPAIRLRRAPHRGCAPCRPVAWDRTARPSGIETCSSSSSRTSPVS